MASTEWRTEAQINVFDDDDLPARLEVTVELVPADEEGTDDHRTTAAGNGPESTLVILVADRSGSMQGSWRDCAAGLAYACERKFEAAANGGAGRIGLEIVTYANHATRLNLSEHSWRASIDNEHAGGGTNFQNAFKGTTDVLADYRSAHGVEAAKALNVVIVFMTDGCDGSGAGRAMIAETRTNFRALGFERVTCHTLGFTQQHQFELLDTMRRELGTEAGAFQYVEPGDEVGLTDKISGIFDVLMENHGTLTLTLTAPDGLTFGADLNDESADVAAPSTSNAPRTGSASEATITVAANLNEDHTATATLWIDIHGAGDHCVFDLVAEHDQSDAVLNTRLAAPVARIEGEVPALTAILGILDARVGRVLAAASAQANVEANCKLPVGTVPTPKSTVAIVPAAGSEVHAAIQAIREIHDRHTYRWPPHINLLYPFAPSADLPVAAAMLTAVCRPHAPFSISFDGRFEVFSQREEDVVWAVPVINPPGALEALMTTLGAAFPDFARAGGFTPHLTVAQTAKGNGPALAAQLAADWNRDGAAVAMTVDRLDVMERGPETPFALAHGIPLSGDGDTWSDWSGQLEQIKARLRTATGGRRVFSLRRADRETILAAKESINQKLTQTHTMLAQWARGEYQSTSSRARLAELASGMQFTDACRQRRMNERVQRNVVTLKHDLAAAAAYEPDAEALAQVSVASRDLFACSLTLMAWDELLVDERDCLGFGIAVGRPEFALDNATQLRLFDISTTALAREATIEATKHAIDLNGFEDATGGFRYLGGADEAGVVLRGRGREPINAWLPLYINAEHYRLVAHVLKPSLGWLTTLDPMGYASDQLHVLFAALGTMVSRLVHPVGERQALFLAQFARTCRAVADDFGLVDAIAKTVSDFAASPAGRTRDILPNLLTLVGYVAVLDPGAATDGEGAAAAAAARPAFWLAFMQEALRRSFNTVFSGANPAVVAGVCAALAGAGLRGDQGGEDATASNATAGGQQPSAERGSTSHGPATDPPSQTSSKSINGAPTVVTPAATTAYTADAPAMWTALEPYRINPGAGVTVPADGADAVELQTGRKVEASFGVRARHLLDELKGAGKEGKAERALQFCDAVEEDDARRVNGLVTTCFDAEAGGSEAAGVHDPDDALEDILATVAPVAFPSVASIRAAMTYATAIQTYDQTVAELFDACDASWGIAPADFVEHLKDVFAEANSATAAEDPGHPLASELRGIVRGALPVLGEKGQTNAVGEVARATVALAIANTSNKAAREAIARGETVALADDDPVGSARTVLAQVGATVRDRVATKAAAAREALLMAAQVRRMAAMRDPWAFVGALMAAMTERGAAFSALMELMGDDHTVIPDRANKVHVLCTGTWRGHGVLASGNTFLPPKRTRGRLEAALGAEEWASLYADIRATIRLHVYRESGLPNRHGHSNDNPYISPELRDILGT